MIHIDEKTVRRLLPYHLLMRVVRDSLIHFSKHECVQPVRHCLEVPGTTGFMFSMSAVMPESMGVKVVNYYPDNPAQGLPADAATVLLSDPATGTPLAVLEATALTDLRTPAASAIATDLLAPDNASVLAVLGTGAQAHSHIELLREVRDFQEVRIWGHNPKHAESLAAQVGGRCCASAEEVVREADVIVTATSAHEPILKGEWLKQGAHVNAVGATRPTWRELDDGVMAQQIYVDSYDGALKESGDIILSGAKPHAELGEALADPSLAHKNITTVFKSLGMAVEDIACAHSVYQSFLSENLEPHP